ncbi:uncharacterized protein LOC119185477 [Rhipicephalus microplus]|uniref:uncharacterized protein LOC119185477 n=1 Tax=Rhipicephalus microplus TaxID=6941 RepID=UPI003F6CE636
MAPLMTSINETEVDVSKLIGTLEIQKGRTRCAADKDSQSKVLELYNSMFQSEMLSFDRQAMEQRLDAVLEEVLELADILDAKQQKVKISEEDMKMLCKLENDIGKVLKFK